MSSAQEDVPKEMPNGVQEDVPKEDAQGQNTLTIPDEWKDKDFEALFKDGWKPANRRKNGVLARISLRRGANDEMRLGDYDEARWNLLNNIYLKTVPKKPMPDAQAPSGLLSGTIAKPQALKAHMGVSLEVLNWYEWAQRREGVKFSGSLGDFINSVVHNYFEDSELSYDVLIGKGENKVGN